MSQITQQEKQETKQLEQLLDDLGIPKAADPDNFWLLTWNIAQFNDTKSDRAIRYMATIMQRFDIIAIQEVKSNLGGIEQLAEALDQKYAFLFSDVSGNSERLAFCYRKSSIQFTGLAAEIVNSPGAGRRKGDDSNLEIFSKVKNQEEINPRIGGYHDINEIYKKFEIFSKEDKLIEDFEIFSSKQNKIKKGDIFGKSNKFKVIEVKKYSSSNAPNGKGGIYLRLKKLKGDEQVSIVVTDKILEFDRTPYLASFRKNNCNFIITTAHIFHGKKSSKEVLYRKQEIEFLADYLQTTSGEDYALDSDYIVCGDFNIEKAVKYELSELEESDKDSPSRIRKELFKALTDKGLIIPKQIQDSPSNLKQDMYYDQIGFHKYSDSTIEFRNGGSVNWIGKLFSEIGNGNPSKNRGTITKMRNALSDHIPIWAKFSISDDTNPKKINI